MKIDYLISRIKEYELRYEVKIYHLELTNLLKDIKNKLKEIKEL